MLSLAPRPVSCRRCRVERDFLGSFAAVLCPLVSSWVSVGLIFYPSNKAQPVGLTSSSLTQEKGEDGLFQDCLLPQERKLRLKRGQTSLSSCSSKPGIRTYQAGVSLGDPAIEEKQQ